MTPKKNRARRSNGAPQSITTICNPKNTPVDAKAQRHRVLAMLRRRSRTTIELRSAGVLMPATRVHELRRAGHDIVTARVTRVDAEGFLHRGVALYSLTTSSRRRA
ncbi:helix-turn-helix domain-containing protein [Burkholderia ubonensis]|uniref:helix-turn-helix domain-containing protein n=1 Tax=Burkholderia ubonensis TaxID=101571 RepID=UPI000B4E1549